ncbi:MAG TPA: hypothetical protein VLT33_28415 [Labilithrix sp.]|nr:hypothetical protein [Labilithrix sp.]
MLRAPARGLVAFSSVLLAVAACHQGEPPAPIGLDAAVAPLPPPPAGSAAGGAAAGSATAASPASASPASATAELDAGADPGALPQTKDRPEATGAAYEARVAALWEGIAKDDPERAMPFFFPLGAYEQVKAISNAGSDWRRRLVAAYKRDVHALHKRLGEHPETAKLLRAELPQDRARWVEPNEEYNKLGYYRVYGTRLVFELDGKERSFEITSLISWRGEWYVVHLTGFK